MPKANSPATPTPDPNDEMTALLKKYLEWLAVRNYSEKTVKIRLLCVGYFIAWAVQRGLNKPGEVTKPVVERYQRFLFNLRKENGDPLSTRTQVSSIRMLKQVHAATHPAKLNRKPGDEAEDGGNGTSGQVQ